MDDPREAERLAEKVNPAEWVARYFEPHLPREGRALDVGCGPGVIAAEIAQRRPDLEVIGLDQSSDRLDFARERHANAGRLAFEQGDAAQLPFNDNSFDFVYSRFLLEYLPDKEKAVSEMVRVLRPGGRIVLQDLDGQLAWHYPVDAQLQQSIDRTMKALARTGFDPFVGRKLYSFLYNAGAMHLVTAIDPYHLHAGSIEARHAELWKTKLAIARSTIAAAVGGTDQADRLIERFVAHLQDDSTLTYSVLFTVHAQGPPSPPPGHGGLRE